MYRLEEFLAISGSMLAMLYVVIGLLGTAMSVLSYYIYCMPQEKIAKKLRAGSTWMAYVPFARNVQRMKMAGMPMWKLMFVGSTFTFSFSVAVLVLFSLIFYAMKPVLGFVVMVLLIVVYFVFYVLESYKYNLIIAGKFGYDKPLAFVWTFPYLVPVVGTVFTYAVALSSRIQPNGFRAASAPVAAPSAAPAAAPSGAFGLEGVTGMYAGAQFKMSGDEEFKIGRDGELCDIVISAKSEKVSRRHCTVKFIASSNCYQVTDYSMNGTFYGPSAQRLPKDQPTQLQRGTTLIIGNKDNQFKLM